MLTEQLAKCIQHESEPVAPTKQVVTPADTIQQEAESITTYEPQAGCSGIWPWEAEMSVIRQQIAGTMRAIEQLAGPTERVGQKAEPSETLQREARPAEISQQAARSTEAIETEATPAETTQQEAGSAVDKNRQQQMAIQNRDTDYYLPNEPLEPGPKAVGERMSRKRVCSTDESSGPKPGQRRRLRNSRGSS